MKIALHLGQTEAPSRETSLKALERDILSAQHGDWNAKNNLARTFLPLLTSLAEKRASERAQINALIDAGKQGLFVAAAKYKASTGPGHFQVFALDFIEKSMDSALSGGGGIGGLFRKLFKR